MTEVSGTCGGEISSGPVAAAAAKRAASPAHTSHSDALPSQQQQQSTITTTFVSRTGIAAGGSGIGTTRSSTASSSRHASVPLNRARVSSSCVTPPRPKAGYALCGAPLQTLERTPSNSMNWPSVRRSASSVTAGGDITRDTSRRSDVMLMSSSFAEGVSDRHRSTHSRTSYCSSRDPESDPARFVQHQRCLSNDAVATAASAMAPPLLGDMSAVAIESRGSLSLPSTNACTPRDFAGIMGTPPMGSRYPHYSAPAPPLDVYVQEAEAMEREKLEKAVEELRTENRKLSATVARSKETLPGLQRGMEQSYFSVERQQESITNTLTRRMDVAKRNKERLMRHLARVEKEKSRQEAQLRSTRINIDSLTQNLKNEETQVTLRMGYQLRVLQQQRQQLDAVLVEQSASLQELDRLVLNVQKMGVGAMGGVTPPPQPTEGSANRQDTTPVQHNRQYSSASQTSRTSSSTVTSPALGATLMSGATSDAAYDPQDMIHYLEVTIASVESLQAEAVERAATYAERKKRLAMRLEQEVIHSAREIPGGGGCGLTPRRQDESLMEQGKTYARLTSTSHARSDEMTNMSEMSSADVSVHRMQGTHDISLSPDQRTSLLPAHGAPPPVPVISKRPALESPRSSRCTPPLQSRSLTGLRLNSASALLPEKLLLPGSTGSSALVGGATHGGGHGSSEAGDFDEVAQRSMSVHDTSRMGPPRLISSAECTPRRNSLPPPPE